MKVTIDITEDEAAEVRDWLIDSAPRRTMPWQELGNRMTQRVADALVAAESEPT